MITTQQLVGTTSSDLTGVMRLITDRVLTLVGATGVGIALRDGYDIVFQKGTVIEVGCWAHSRRKFYDARTSDPERSHGAIAWIGRLRR